MRLVKYFAAASLDGFISRTDGSVDWLFTDDDYGRTEFFETVDVAVMGRKTYDRMLQLSPSQPSFANMENYVFSLSVAAGPHGKVNFVSGPPARWLEGIRDTPGKDIWLVGGGHLVRHFLAEGLVDQIGLGIHPRLLGSGIPLFPPRYPETVLELISCRHYPTGLIQVLYSVKR